jgi:hypothetical protein
MKVITKKLKDKQADELIKLVESKKKLKNRSTNQMGEVEPKNDPAQAEFWLNPFQGNE